MRVVVVAIVAFVFAFVGSMPVAGPVSVVVVSRAIQKRRAEALGIGVGAAIAEGVYAFAAFFGFTTFVPRHPSVLPIAHGVTAVVLLAVGVRFVFFRESDASQRRAEESAEKRRARGFLLGLSIAALNPTLLVTWSAAVTAVYSRQLVQMTQWLAVPWGIAAALGVAAWNLAVVALFRRYGQKFPRRALVWIVRAMGLALIGIAVWSGAELVMYLGRGR